MFKPKALVVSIALVALIFTLTSPAAAQVSLPWTEDFEGATGSGAGGYTANQSPIPGLTGSDHAWRYEKTLDGRLVTDSPYVHAGTKSLSFDESDSSNGNYSQNYGIVQVDMSNYDASCDVVHLSFWFAETGDEVHTGDRIWVRGSSSSSWVQLYDWSATATTSWQQITGQNVSLALTGAGQSFSSTFEIRFGQNDNFPRASDGVAFDDLALSLSSTSCAVLPFSEDFENTTNATYTADGAVVGSTDFAYEDGVADGGRLRTRATTGHNSSTGVLTMDSSSGLADNYTILTLNLSSFTVASDTVVLDYWFVDHADETHTTYDTVWVRGNNTGTWRAVNSWQGQTSNTWHQKTGLNLSTVLSGFSEDFSSTTQIRWGQYDNTSVAGGDGFSFDDVCVRLSSQSCGAPSPGTIGDRVWNDANGNGTDDSEAGIASVTVRLKSGTCAGSTVQTKVTTSTGAFDFTNVTPGTYCVDVDNTTLPAGATLTGGTEPLTVNLTSGQDYNSADFGYQISGGGGGGTVTYENTDTTSNTIDNVTTPCWTGSLSRTFSVSESMTITDVNVGVNVTHTYRGDLRMRLTSPNATTANFIWGSGANRKNYDVLVDSDSANGLDDGDDDNVASPYYENERTAHPDTGASAPNNALDAFDGETSNGTWTLEICDASAGDSGTYNRAKIVITGTGGGTASIGDRIWEDANGNGTDDSEPGISGVSVQLRSGTCAGPVSVTKVTSAVGTYDFTNLVAGTYCVDVLEASLPSGAVKTGGTEPRLVTITSGQDYNGADVGYRIDDATIGDRIWQDSNGNGTDDSEPGLSGVTVNLRSGSCAGSVVQTKVTGATGSYDFTGLQAGTYCVDVLESSLPTGATHTGGTEPKLLTLTARQDYNTADVGYRIDNATIGDRIWADDDGDGIQDAGEGGLSGVTVQLRSGGCSGSVIKTDVTDGTGAYDFTTLAAGTYCVDVLESSLPAGATHTGGTEPRLLSLSAGQDYNLADVGYQVNDATIGDKIWEDADGNGLDNSEGGVSGVTVWLKGGSCAGATVQTKVTNGAGAYDFTGLAAGTYCVDVDETSLPGGATHTGGTEPRLVTIVGHQDYDLADIGYQISGGSLGGYLWDDENGDNSAFGETGRLEGVTVYARSGSATGPIKRTAVTAADGTYTLDGLIADTYWIDVDDSTLPPNYTYTGTAEPLGGIGVSSSTNYNFFHFGYQGPQGHIGDRIYDDLNVNGSDDSEPGVALVTVRLRDTTCAGAILETQQTDSTGFYNFKGYLTGTYCVDVDETTLPAGSTLTTGNEPLIVNLGVDEDYNDADFGYDLPATGPGSIGDLIFEDVDASGTYNAGDIVLGGIVVELQNGVCTPGTDCPRTMSNASGVYTFSGLFQGNYTVDVVDGLLPTGTTKTTTDPVAVTLGDGQAFTNADFGLDTPPMIRGCFWEDQNYDGIRQSGEDFAVDKGAQIQANVTAFPFSTSGGTINLTTGCYEIPISAAGDYTPSISFKNSATFEDVDWDVNSRQNGMRWHTLKDVGDDLADSDFGIGSATFGHSYGSVFGPTITHDGESTVSAVDMGWIVSPVLGDRVFRDLDQDGIQDANEPGIPGVTVEVWRPAGSSPYYTTVTRFDGSWEIGNFWTFRESTKASSLTALGTYLEGDLLPGDWYLKYILPSGMGFTFSPKDAGGDDTLDSDADATGKTDTFTLTSNSAKDLASDSEYDAGVYTTCTTSANKIKGLVFQDYNGNGLLDPLEGFFSGTTVKAYNNQNNLVATTTTTANGTYELSVPNGTPVRVEFTSLANGSNPGPVAGGTGSTVQFVTSPACGVSISINRPQDYCQPGARAASTCFVQSTGDQSLAAVLDFPWDASDQDPPWFQGASHNYPASAAQVGSLYGLAYHRSSQQLFAGATASATTSLPPDGLGAIYSIDYSTDPETVTLFIDLAAAMLSEHSISDYSGTITDPPPLLDPKIGKVGLGDIELSKDEQTLWAINVADSYRELVELPLGAGGTAPAASAILRHAIPLDQGDCVNDGDIRPWGLGFNHSDATDDNVYVGVVCSAESTATAANLKAYVYTFNPTTDTFTQVLNVPLTYLHRDFNSNAFVPWGFMSRSPEPMVADIEFDQGDMVIGIRSRSGDFKHEDVTASGDILRACKVGATWTIENNGSCGGRTTLGANNTQGIGGGEYYFADDSAAFRGESALGGLASRPGFPEIIASTKDGHYAFFNGFSWFTADGAKTRQYDVISGHGDVYGKTNGLGDVEILCDAPSIEIGNRVWADIDEDGIQDAGEAPLSGVDLELLDGSCAVVASATTNAAGEFYFIGSTDPRAPHSMGDASVGQVSGSIAYNSTYYIRVKDSNFTSGNALAGYQATVAGQGSDLHDSEASSVSCGTRAATTFVGAVVNTGGAGVNMHSLDLGFGDNPVVGSIGDTVWFDANRDGTEQGSEEGIADVTVRLYVDDGDGSFEPGGDDTLLSTMTTDSNGFYAFGSLLAGSYWVDPVESSLPSGFSATTGTPAQALVNLPSGENLMNADFGYAPATGVALGDFIWHDDNANGLQDKGEAGIKGVDVTVTGPGSYSQTATTKANGFYLVTGITQTGTYTATVDTSDLPAGIGTTPTNQPSAAEGFYVDLSADVLLADYGFTGGATGGIGDRVWHDVDGDGVQDAGEPGIKNVTVNLTDSNGDLVATTTTGGGGIYGFTGLVAGDYRVEVTDLSGILSGLNLTTASNPTALIALAAGAEYTDADFGYSSPGLGTVGNFVWHDVDGDGVYDVGEQGLERVWLGLWKDENANGTYQAGIDSLQQQQKTDRDGGYLFKNVPFGTYFVIVHDTEDVTDQFGMTSGATGQDNNSQASPYPVTITSSRTPAVLTADFGFTASVTSYSLSGTVWFDGDADGNREPPAESGVGNVTVELYRDLDGDGVLDPTDPMFGTQTSKATTPNLGSYQFTGLPNGTDWIVVVDTSGSFLDGAIQTTQLATASVEPVSISGANSPNHDFGYSRPSTDALVSEFETKRGPRGVQVEFQTASEVGTVGYWLYRSNGDAFEKANDRMIPAVVGAGQGSTYRLPDAGAEAGVEYEYWVLEIEMSGVEQWHGPYMATAEDVAAEPVDRVERSVRSSAVHEARVDGLDRNLRQRAGLAAGAGAVGDRARVEVTAEGVYRVSVADIAAVTAATSESVQAGIATGDLRIVSNGEDVAWWPLDVSFGVASAVGFYAPAPSSHFANYDVYFVELAAGSKAPTSSAVPAGGASSNPVGASAVFEDDVFYATAALRDDTVDFWYWKPIVAGNPTAGTQTVGFELDGAAGSGMATVSLEVYSATKAADNPDHGLEVLLNDVSIGQVDWDGDGPRTHQLTFEGSLLQASNTLELVGVLHPGVAQSVVYLDKFTVDYLRNPAAESNQLSLVAESGGNHEVSGFSSAAVQALDVSDPRMAVRLSGGAVDEQAGSTTYSWNAAAGASYFLYGSEAVTNLTPTASRRPTMVEAEYLVFAPPELASGAQELANYRALDGLSTSVVDLLDVWDEYGDGQRKGSAVGAYLAEAWNSWSTKPVYAVIVGKGTLDFKGVQEANTNLAPPEMVATPQGLFASDAGLGDVVGDDGVPEVIVGRIPAVSEVELMDFISKMAGFESTRAPNVDRVLLVADNDDEAGDFDGDAEEVAALLDGYKLDKAYFTPGAEATIRATIKTAIENGVWMVNFIGHGGLDRFAAEGLLTTADVATLGPQARLPIVSSMTCSVGRFELPGYTSLGEALVADEDGGAVAVWAPSGLSINDGAHELNKAFVTALRERETLGEAMRDAMAGYEGSDIDFPHMLEIYNLLGDPALRVGGLPMEDTSLFGDDFESSSTSAWSRVVGE